MFPWGAGLVGAWLPTFLMVLFTTLLVLTVFGGRPKNFPPGLMILPVVGSLLSMPLGPSVEMLRGLRKKYGDISSFAIFGTRMVVVSGVSLMKEVNRIVTEGRSPGIGIIGSSGQVWQEQRRFMLHHLRDLGFGKSSYEPVMIEEIAELMDLITKEEGSPLEMRRLFNRSVINILWAMVMGQRYHYGDAKLEKLMVNLGQPADFNALTPAYHIPHLFKFMEYLPRHSSGYKFIRTLSDFLKKEIKDFMADEELRNGDNFTALFLKEIEKKENPNFNMDQLAGLVFDLFVAGMETTSSTLTAAVNLISKHPEVQRRMQEELDEVVGRDRLPTFSDVERLPYVQATINEVQRVLNLIKYSLPHQTNEDCKLCGYDIPKGTWLLTNLDDALRNSEYWKNATEFDPQNFLDEYGKYKKNNAFMPFGVGKRVCAGEPLARLELFLFITHLYQRFTFTLVEEHKSIVETNPMFNSPPEYSAIAKCRPIIQTSTNHNSRGMSSVLAWNAGLVGAWLPTFLLVLFTTLLLLSVLGRRPKNFPPGMMILPVVGSLLSMPFGPSVEILRGLRKKYGDIASFGIFGTRVVLVSGVSVMKEVFALRNTTDRPEMIFTTVRNRILTDGRTTEVGIGAVSGQLWQEQRRFLLHHLRDLGFGKSSYEPVMVEEISELMECMSKEKGRPLEMRRLFNRSVINILWAMVMGRRYPYGHVKLNKLIHSFVQPADFNILSPVQHIPHILKIMEYIPTEKEGLTKLRNILTFVKEEIKEFMADEELRNGDNFTALYLKEIEKKANPNFNMDQLMGVIFDLFVAGMETTSSTLTTAVNLIAKHPHVQRRVQEELDEVVGRNRLPSFSDMERLPYVQATIHEVQRVLSLAKFAVPHMTSEDCKLGGYDIPKGTWLMANLDDALKNSEYWKNAREFDPQNFLDENGKYKRNNAFMPFGVGKRACAGEPLARLELFLFFTHLFQRFTFTLVEEQKPIIETNPTFNAAPEYTASVKCRPK
ncbi:hypothetical protein O3P69_006759 [Scylla paramamosain]|uniref:Cytochrome P450 2U1 n=1 Tax=Scylla paramamosain TaxID=85552 RepID=A0AAW0U1P1_SCYPA